MKIVRVYSDERGETHFSEVEVELADAGQIGLLSRPLAAKSVIFRKNRPDYDRRAYRGHGWASAAQPGAAAHCAA